jgi:hypothetical protein
MPDVPQRTWATVLDLVLKFFAGVFIPAAILIVGNWLSVEQRVADLDQRNADRVTTLLKHLASSNSKERILAIHMVGHFAHHNQLPLELLPVILVTYNKDNDPDVREAATTVLPFVAKSDKLSNPQVEKNIIRKALDNPKLSVSMAQAARNYVDVQDYIVKTAESDPDSARNLPSRIYIHIRDDRQRDKGKQVKDKLSEEGFIIPDLIKIGEKVPDNIELRYFRKYEKDEAIRIVDMIRSLNIDAKDVYIPGYENSLKIHPRHYELWFGRRE